MPEYKRITQLGEQSESTIADYLAIDREDQAEAKKISVDNLLQDTVKIPDQEDALPGATWARRNGDWVQIFPDLYVLEAAIDGRMYLRYNGDWVSIGDEGLAGDMYKGIYDSRNVHSDMFNAAFGQDNYFSHLGDAIVSGSSKLVGNFLNDECIFQEGMKKFQYIDTPLNTCVLENVKIYVSEQDIFQNRLFAFGYYPDADGDYPAPDSNVIHSTFFFPVEAGQNIKLQNLGENTARIRFIEVDQTNGKIGVLPYAAGNARTEYAVFDDSYTVSFDRTTLVGIEYQDGTVVDGDFVVSEDFTERFNDAYYRFRIPIIGSATGNITTYTYNLSAPESPNNPIDIDLLNGKATIRLKQVEIPFAQWSWEFEESGFVQARAPFNYDTDEVEILGYTTVETTTLTPQYQVALVEEQGKKYVEIVTNQNNSLNPNFSLTVFYKATEERKVDKINLPDGSYCVVARSTYLDGTQLYGKLYIDQDGIVKYYVRNSGGHITGELEVDGRIVCNNKIVVNNIESHDGQQKLDITSDFNITTPNEFNVESQDATIHATRVINITGDQNVNITSKQVVIQSTGNMTLNGEDVLIEPDFQVNGNNKVARKDWQPQVKTKNTFGVSKDVVNEEYLADFYTPRDGNNLVQNSRDNTISNYNMHDIVGQDFDITNLNLSGQNTNRATIIDNNGQLVASQVSTAQLNTLLGINTDQTIQAQLDAIPKLHYLDGQTLIITDSDISEYLPDGKDLSNATEVEIDQAMVDFALNKLDRRLIFDSSYVPKEWDAIALRLQRENLETFKDAMFYYDKSERWIFLYFLSTTVNRADGTNAGIVENSNDITFANGQGTVNYSAETGKLRVPITIAIIDGATGSATLFDGSQAIKIPVTALNPDYLSKAVPVNKGGTGLTTLTSNQVLIGNGTGNVKFTGANAGALFRTTGTAAPEFGTLPVAQGGTGVTSIKNIVTNLASTAAANALTTNIGVTGVLSIANGGTAMTTNPSLLINLAVNTADTVFKATPRPGVTGNLPLTNGGTGSNSAAGARTNLDVYSKKEVDDKIATSGGGDQPVPDGKTIIDKDGVWSAVVPEPDGVSIVKNKDNTLTAHPIESKDEGVTYKFSYYVLDGALHMVFE